MSQYFENDRNLKSDEKKINVCINNKSFSFYTDNGVFSKKGLDFGTRTLLESLPERLEGNVLDIGCGYGPIGIYLKSTYNVLVDMVDVNERSLKLCEKNAKLNMQNVNIFLSNAYENIIKKYDYIITNPPIRVGKEKLYEILLGAKEYLNDHGKLYFVINKDQGAKSVMRNLEKVYKVELVKKNKGFFVICAYN